MLSFMVVSKRREVVDQIRKTLSSEGVVESKSDRDSALAALRKKRHDIVFIDSSALFDGLGNVSYETAASPFKELYANIEIVVMADTAGLGVAAPPAAPSISAGVCNYLARPVSKDDIKAVAESIVARGLRKSELEYLRDRFVRVETDEVIRTQCENVKEVFDKARSVAPTKTTVLLAGETGVGKGVLAKLIHVYSRREKAQFISVHCGAIPDTLLESELFGHEKGAFTGAIRRKLGKFEIAKGGTIFLDEIGTITPSAQIKLLQVLQDGTFSRVGGDDLLRSDARVVAATNSDLKQMAEDGLFRKDLYYRLNVFPIEIPPLRERIDDIPLFIEAFVKKHEMSDRKGITGVQRHVVAALKRYSWPGNIRELENLIERAYILEESSVLTPKSFPGEFFNVEKSSAALSIILDDDLTLAEARKKATEEFERQYLRKLLSRHDGKIGASADAAGITTRQLHKLMSKYGIHKEEYKKGPRPRT